MCYENLGIKKDKYMQTQKIKLEKIFLDPNNYRFQKDLDNSKIETRKIPTAGVQKRIFSKIKNDPKIKDLEESILFIMKLLL